MNTRGFQNSVYDLVTNIGRAALHSQYPNDFEYYLLAFELISYNGAVIDFFAFPIMPSSIRVGKVSAVNVKKSFGGVFSTSTEKFIPFEISINGNFGRNFKIVSTTGDLVDFKAINYSINSRKYKRNYGDLGVEVVDPIFNFSIKSGYGCLKILESLFEKARGTIDGKRNMLIFYNMALGQYHVVEPITFNEDQSEDQNMLWRYSLQMTAVADAIDLGVSGLNNVLKKATIQNAANLALSQVRELL
jgi:hypothetical protein